jgi:spore coat polysaccharide biosynthesis protein SpsF (cytidylyltransferase family)
MNVRGGYLRSIEYPPVIAIVQARLGSQRFPNKMLADLGGRPLLEWVVKRLQKAKTIHQVVVASPDKELKDMAYSLGAWGYHDTGDPNNVLARFVKAANWANAEIVVRICGDSPLIDPEIVDNTVNSYLENRVDIASNVLRRTFAKGMDVEVMHRNVLKRIFHLTEDTRYREHVTLFAYENPALFVFKSIYDFEDLSWINTSVDTKHDLDKIAKVVFNYIGDSLYMNYKEIKNNFRMV